MEPRFDLFKQIGEVNIIDCIIFFLNIGISHWVLCPHMHQQNDIVERKHLHIVETGLALLAQASLPVRFLDEAFLTTCYLINQLPTRVLNNNTHLICLLKITPDYSMLHTFGCTCWSNLRPYNTIKLAFRSKKCVFLGYSSLHKGYKYLDRSFGRVYIWINFPFCRYLLNSFSYKWQYICSSCSSAKTLCSFAFYKWASS